MIIPMSLLAGSVSLDLVALYCLKRSNGFKLAAWGLGGLLLVILAFVLLSFVLNYLPLGVAYSAWGSMGVIGTVIIDRYLFGNRLGNKGLLGIACIVAGIVILQL